MALVSVKEHDYLISGVNISTDAFNWLKNFTDADDEEGEKLPFLRYDARNCVERLKVKNYVGLIQTPDGTQIEILPKIQASIEAIDNYKKRYPQGSLTDLENDKAINDLLIRQTLIRMLRVYLGLNALNFQNADILRINSTLLEIFISQFLQNVNHVVKRGIRSNYNEVTENLNYYRGRLNVSGQIRQNLVHQERFHMTYDEYSPDRAENRLIHSAVKKVMKLSKDLNNQRFSRELYYAFADIPLSTNYKNDLTAWSKDRNIQHYEGLKIWCAMILKGESPLAFSGDVNTITMLFPMEKVFEYYVGYLLKKQFYATHTLKTQATSKYLVQFHAPTSHPNGQKPGGLFQLRPDFIMEEISRGPNQAMQKKILVLDAKWKPIDASKTGSGEKYGISQADIYQMFAYGQKYLNGVGELYLLYPKSEMFEGALKPFHYSVDEAKPENNLTLYVVPVDLAGDEINKDGWILFPEECELIINKV